jgi:hypothetical protein
MNGFEMREWRGRRDEGMNLLVAYPHMAIFREFLSRASQRFMAEHSDLLSILQAHGQQFVNSFSLPPPNGNKRKAKEEHSGPHTKIHKLEHHESEEWLGFCEDERDELSSEVGKGGPDGSLNLSQILSKLSSFFQILRMTIQHLRPMS